MATHSSIPACKIPGTEEPGRLQSVGSQRVEDKWRMHRGGAKIPTHSDSRTCALNTGSQILSDTNWETFFPQTNEFSISPTPPRCSTVEIPRFLWILWTKTKYISYHTALVFKTFQSRSMIQHECLSDQPKTTCPLMEGPMPQSSCLSTSDFSLYP